MCNVFAGGIKPRHSRDVAVRGIRVRSVEQRARRAAPHLPARQRLKPLPPPAHLLLDSKI